MVGCATSSPSSIAVVCSGKFGCLCLDVLMLRCRCCLYEGTLLGWEASLTSGTPCCTPAAFHEREQGEQQRPQQPRLLAVAAARPPRCRTCCGGPPSLRTAR